MEKKYLIGLDAGTTRIKAVLFDFSGTQLAVTSIDNNVVTTDESRNEQDMEVLWQNVGICIRKLMQNSLVHCQEIAAIGLSAQGEGLWPIDNNAVPVRNAILWNDGRATEIITALQMNTELYNKIKLVVGSFIKPGSTLTLIKWFAENEPELFSKTNNFFTCKDWIRYRITGKLYWELTDASCSCIDIQTCRYPVNIFDALEISTAITKFPPLIGATDQAGTVTPTAAKFLGLCPGIPVSGGMIDVVSTSVGAGATKVGSVCTILGTTGMNLVTLDKYQPDLLYNGWERHLDKNKFVTGMGMMAATPNQDWVLKEIFGLQEFTQEFFQETNAILTQMAPGEGGLLYLPHISTSGERAPFFDPNAAAQVMGIKTTTTKYEILHAVMEGVALGIRDCLHSFQSSQPIYLTGGGANNVVWSQIISDCTNRDIYISDASELAAKGAAISAALMVGVFRNSEEASTKFCRIKQMIRPNPNNHEKYNSIFAMYKSVQKSTEKFWQWRTAFLRGSY